MSDAPAHDTRPIIRTLIVCPTICPGGGPPGYTYNLRAGLAALADDAELGETVRGVRFLGIELGMRNRATGTSAPVPAPEQSATTLLARSFAVAKTTFGRIHPRTLARRARKTAKRWRTLLDSDLVVFQGYQSPKEARWMRRLGKIVVYMPHSPSVYADEVRMMSELSGTEPPLTRRRHRALLRRERGLFRAAHVAVFPAANAALAYEVAFGRTLASRRIAYVSSGIEAPALADATGSDAAPLFPPGTVNVLFAGRYVPHKGYDLFVEAAEALVTEGTTASFWTLGDGPLKRSTNAVTDLGWSDSPHGFISQSDIIVVPNRIAYFDLLPLEAAALGVGLVLTEVGGNIDQLERLPDSVGATPDSVVSAMREAIARKQDDPVWGQRNADAYRREFTDAHMARCWATLLGDLAPSPHRRRSGHR